MIRWIAEDDLDHEQIAGLLQRTPGATREYISQCRKKARHYFRDWYVLAAREAREKAAIQVASTEDLRQLGLFNGDPTKTKLY